MCSNPIDVIKITNWINLFPDYGGHPQTEDTLKRSLIKYGPLAVGIISAGHEMILVGFDTDSTDNKTIWHFKDSGGSDPTYDGYAHIKVGLNNMYYIYALLTPIKSTIYTDDDIKCVDLDGDGYYNWGIGPKPANCPACVSDEEDGDDSNPNLGPMDINGFCQQLTAPITYPTISITSNTTWDTKQTLCGDLVISNGATLTISNQLIMPVCSTITIQGNSKLIVDGGKITYANIVVNSGSEFDLQNNGILELYRNDELSIDTGAVFNNTYGEVKVLTTY